MRKIAKRFRGWLAFKAHILSKQSTLGSKAENRGVVVTEVGSYSRRVDSCTTQLKAQGPSRTCSESKEEDEKEGKVCGKRS